MSNFKKDYDEYAKVMARIRKSSIEELKSLCEKNNGKVEIDLNWEGFFTVTYDGGRHPEYATNAFSQVYSVFLKNGEVYLEIEDCEEYEASRVPTTELADIANGILTFTETKEMPI